MILRFRKDPIRELLVMVQQKYDNEPVTFPHMSKSIQEVASIFPTLALMLKGRLGMDVGRYFRSSYTKGIYSYKKDKDLDK